EGAAVVAEGKVYVGAGHGGVLCLAPAKLTLNGKEQSPEEIRKTIEAEWKKLVDKYEAEKKVDPDFAVPPSEDSLPKATPRLVLPGGLHQGDARAPPGTDTQAQ